MLRTPETTISMARHPASPFETRDPGQDSLGCYCPGQPMGLQPPVRTGEVETRVPHCHQSPEKHELSGKSLGPTGSVRHQSFRISTVTLQRGAPRSSMRRNWSDFAERLPDSVTTRRKRLHLLASRAYSLSLFRGYGDPTVEEAHKAALALSDKVDEEEDLGFTLYGLFSFHASRGDYADNAPFSPASRRWQMTVNPGNYRCLRIKQTRSNMS